MSIQIRVKQTLVTMLQQLQSEKTITVQYYGYSW